MPESRLETVKKKATFSKKDARMVSDTLVLLMLRYNRIFQAAVGCCFLNFRWIAGLAFIPINLYNGQRGFIQGPIAKYLFYAFYPVHLLVLYVFMRLLG